MFRSRYLFVVFCLASCLVGTLSAQDNQRRGMRTTDYVNGQLYGADQDHPIFHAQAAGHHGAHQPGNFQQGGNYYNNGYSNGYHGGYYNYNSGYSGGGIAGFGVSRPWYGGSSFSLSIGYPYGNSLTYYNGPWYGNYLGYQRPDPYSSMAIYAPTWTVGYAPYGANYYPRSNYIDYYLPPTYYPAEVAYGPQAMKQFLGVDRNFALGPLQAAPRVAAKPSEEIRPVVREIDWEGRRKADKFLTLGDDYFQKQKFHDALLRYRMAVDASPDYPEANLRYGFSLIANRRYDDAAKALRKAFTLDPQIVKSAFRIDQLYADNRMVREGHEEALAQAALDAPTDGDLMFDVGMWLIFNGQPERSMKFFEKARDLGVDAGVEL